MDSFQGFNNLIDIVSKYIEVAEDKHKNTLEVAKEFVNDLRKLTKPISEIKKSGYTHLIDTFFYRDKGNEVIVGWGKYYGRMVEYGTSKMASREHFRPVFEKNKEKYYKMMIEPLGINTWK